MLQGMRLTVMLIDPDVLMFGLYSVQWSPDSNECSCNDLYCPVSCL